MKEMQRVQASFKETDRIQILPLDLSKPEECLKTVSEFAERAPKIDLVVNNAGVTMREQFVNTDFSTVQMMLNTNCLSHIAVTKGLLPQMIKNRVEGARFVNIISIAGMIGTGYRTIYSAAKFGTAGFFKALRPEIKQYGIGITNIYPEFVKTNISKNAVLGSGQVFGKTDTNILTGLSVDQAIEVIIKGTYLGHDEVIVGRPIFHIIPYLCFLSTTINNLVCKIAFEKSRESIEKAE